MERHPVLWVRKLNTIKMATLCKAIYRLNAITIKIPAVFLFCVFSFLFCVFLVCLFVCFAEMDRHVLKSIWAQKGFRIAKMILKMKNNVGKLTLSDLKTYCKATLINSMERRINSLFSK